MKPIIKPMKRLSLYLFLILFTLQTPSLADDISDFQIEGMSIGDSLLDYLSEEKINKKKNSYSDKGYIYKSRDFYSLLFNLAKFETYEFVQIHLKDNDKKYKIFNINGVNFYKQNIDKCYSAFDSIEKEFDLMFKNARKVNKKKRPHIFDKSGKSTTTDVYYYFDDKAFVSIVCTDWSDEITKSYKEFDNFAVEIASSEFSKWLTNEAFK
jgi:hypothetical protein